MTQFLISLDEVERVKKLNGIKYTSQLAERTSVSRATWTRVLGSREPTASVLNALASLGARPGRILVVDDIEENPSFTETTAA
ncbi:transcriptional regulator [Corynebacterium diphtheriae]|nr:transcriptional regulator [Corynebacterium diphtheriae]